ncbi:hypothetical protein DAEQUDRAFT_389128 [Daedalea quercina L-15889]|uniref:Uncharacterized protein n=1 Tax=Daedalea quercina L-15889 TaxID=1314783 RepID=A0A165NZC5_9APHY|nr:hypothetical protein DAEQUDRAFT_389128 [Daedalea quercina L-15889]
MRSIRSMRPFHLGLTPRRTRAMPSLVRQTAQYLALSIWQSTGCLSARKLEQTAQGRLSRKLCGITAGPKPCPIQSVPSAFGLPTSSPDPQPLGAAPMATHSVMSSLLCRTTTTRLQPPPGIASYMHRSRCYRDPRRYPRIVNRNGRLGCRQY